MIETTVRRTVHLDAPVAEVWRMLIEPAELQAWFADIDLSAAQGAVSAVIDDDDIARALVIDVVDVERRLGFTWWPADSPDAASSVVFTLDEQDEGTLLTVVEAPVVRSGGMVCQATAAGDPWTDRLLRLELAVLARVGVPV